MPCRAVVVEDRDIHRRPQPLLNHEAFWGFNILQIDAPEARLHQPDRPDKLLWVLRVQFQVNRVQVGKPLKEQCLAFHYRLAGKRPDIPEAENGGAVGDNRHKIATPGVKKRVFGILLDGAARRGDTGRVSEGKVMLRETGFGRHNLQLAVRRSAMVLQGLNI